MKTETLLINARDRIKDPKNWTKFVLYGRRCVKGKPLGTLAGADCFCSVGAVAAELGVPSVSLVSIGTDTAIARLVEEDWVIEVKGAQFERAMRYLWAAAKVIAGKPAAAWEVNDTYGHEEVMKMFDIAIRRARRRHANGG